MPSHPQLQPFSCTDTNGRVNPGVFTPLGFLSIKLQDEQDRLAELLEPGLLQVDKKHYHDLTTTAALVIRLKEYIRIEQETIRTKEAAEALRLQEKSRLREVARQRAIADSEEVEQYRLELEAAEAEEFYYSSHLTDQE